MRFTGACSPAYRAERTAILRFERERRLLASLGEEEGFVPLLDFGDSPRGPYLVMPFLGGGTLRDKLRKGRLSLEESIAVCRKRLDEAARAPADPPAGSS